MELVRVAGAAGIPVLPVKGILTARLLYGDPCERPMVDVDVRIRARDLRALCAVARRAGWPLLERSRSYACVAFQIDGERVEVETRVGPPGLCRITGAAMIARATRHVAPFGVPHLQPEIHDHALLLMVNAFKDKLAWASNGGLEDLARFAARPELSFDVLAARVQEGGVASIAWLVADWMVRERSELRWSALLTRLGERSVRPFYGRAFHSLLRRDRPPSLALRLLARAGSDTFAMRARSLACAAVWSLEERARCFCAHSRAQSRAQSPNRK